MTPDQLATLTALIAGLQAGIVNLAHLLAQVPGGLSKNEIARSYRLSAAALPAEAANRDIVALVLTQIAAGIESSADTAQAPGPAPPAAAVH